MVEILGYDFSIVVLMPLLLILLGVVFFLTIYLKDGVINLIKNLKRHKIKKEKKIPTNFSKEFIHLKNQVPHLNTEETLNAITKFIKKYIAEKLNITKEFSFEELPRDKLDWFVIEFTKRLSDLKYSGKEVTKDEINHLITYLSKIIKSKPLKEAVSRFRLIKFPKIEIRFPKIRLFPKIKKKALLKEHHKKVEIKPLDLGLPEKITIDFRNFFKGPRFITALFEKHHKMIKHLHFKIKVPVPHKAKIEILKEPVKQKLELPRHKIKHHKPSIFEKIRINLQVSKVLKLIRQAEKKVHKNPLASRRLYSHALLMYYKLPIEKEENIAIRLNRFYDKVNGKHEKELLDIKHSGKKSTPEAVKHLKKYKNQVVLEQSHLNNQIKRSLGELKNHFIKQLKESEHNEIREKAYNLLKTISIKEDKILANEENTINNLVKKASSYLNTSSKKEPHKSHDAHRELRKLFSNLKVDHRLPQAPAPIIKPEITEVKIEKVTKIRPPEIKVKSKKIKIAPPKIPQKSVSERMKQLLKDKEHMYNKLEKIEFRRIEIPEIKTKEIKIPSQVKIEKSSDIEIKPPEIPTRRISEKMKKLMEEKENVYKKLKEMEGKELDRFKQTKRMSTHQDLGYRDFLTSLKPRHDLPERHKIKKIFEAK